MESQEGKGKMKRGEIETRAPFRSVKEAVMLFGERVLAGEVYAPNKLKEMNDGASENKNNSSSFKTVTAELEETKQSLEKARERTTTMANCLSSLQEELERTKQELQQLKERESVEKQMIEFEIEHLKFVEDSKETKVKKQSIDHEHGFEFQNKRYVSFSNPPSFPQVMMPQGDIDAILKRHPSLKKKKKKPLIPLFGGLFSKKK